MKITPKMMGGTLVVLALGGIFFNWARITPVPAPVDAPEFSTPSVPGQRTACQVLKLYDGDTLACDLNGNRHIEVPGERVRLLGIDAPEMEYSRKNKSGRNQPFAKEAIDWLEGKTLRKTIYLETDERATDRYGRMLAFAYETPTATRSLNEELIARGYAVTLFIPPNEKYRDALESAEARAKNSRVGLWSVASR